MKLQRRTSYALGVLTTLAALFLVGYVYAALYTTVDVGTSSGVDFTARYIGTNRLDLNGTSSAQITHNGTGTRIWSFPAATGTIVLANASQTLTGKTIAGADNTLTVLESQITDSTVLARLASSDKITGLWNFTHASGLLTNTIGESTSASGVTVDGMLIKDGAILETVITDGAVLARVASVETISGVWTFTVLPQVNGGAFASVANITTHAALTATHGATGAIVGTTNAQTLTGKTIAGADNTLTVLESQITDSTVLARVGSAETISGIWTYTALPQVNGGAFASVANITTHAALQTGVHGVSITAGKTLTVSNSVTLTATDGSTLAIGAGGTLGSAAYTASTAYEASGGIATHAALTATHGVTGAIVGTTDTQTLTGKTITVAGDITLTAGISSIRMSAGSQQLSLFGGTDDTGARIIISGPTWTGGTGLIKLITPNLAGAGVDRLVIAGGTNSVVATWTSVTHAGFGISGNLEFNANNTSNVGVDAGNRPAGVYTVILKAKSTVTGQVYEAEFLPRAVEIYFFGQAVKSFGDGSHYTSTSQYGEPVLGIVARNPVQVVKSNQTITKNVVETVDNLPVTYTVTRKVTEIVNGKKYEVKETQTIQNTTKVERERTLKLWDGSTVKVKEMVDTLLYRDADTNQLTVNLTKTRTKTVTETTPILGDEGSLGLLAVGGRHQVKVCAPTLNNDELIAGPNGCLYPLRTAPNLDGAVSIPTQIGQGVKGASTVDLKIPHIVAIATEAEAVIGDDEDLVWAKIQL